LVWSFTDSEARLKNTYANLEIAMKEYQYIENMLDVSEEEATAKLQCFYIHARKKDIEAMKA